MMGGVSSKNTDTHTHTSIGADINIYVFIFCHTLALLDKSVHEHTDVNAVTAAQRNAQDKFYDRHTEQVQKKKKKKAWLLSAATDTHTHTHTYPLHTTISISTTVQLGKDSPCSTLIVCLQLTSQ